MNNILLDELPVTWDGAEETYYLDADFRIGIQICLLENDEDLTEIEKNAVISNLLFEGNAPYGQELVECVQWFLGGWSHDNPLDKHEDERLMDFDVDQWRIYAAFLSQYHIDLNTAELHWWAFMGLLTSLSECSYTQVMDIRKRKIDPKMDAKSKKQLREAKKVYKLKKTVTHEEKQFMDGIDDLLGSPSQEQKRIEEFEKYARD